MINVSIFIIISTDEYFRDFHNFHKIDSVLYPMDLYNNYYNNNYYTEW
jgi:hypothetical protein